MKSSTPVATFKAQRGGIILGIIIGVLVGLGAALAVAVYVTKVPVPFVNKSPPKVTDQDAAEAKKNKDWDPNTPLYGKNPAKASPAASGAVTVDPSTVIAPATGLSSAKGTATAKAAVAASAAKADKKANTPDDLKTSADPLGDLAKAKTKTATAAAAGSTSSGADPFTYFVQAGAYRTTEDAEAQRAKLGMLGMDAKITEREQSGRTVYRVRVGPFDKKDDAEKTKDKLDGGGLDTALVRTQR